MTRRLVRVLLAGLLGVLAGFGFGPVFGGVPGPALFVIATASVAGAALAIALSSVFLPGLPPPLLVVAGTIVVVTLTAVVTGTGTEAVHGPWQLLTAALPVEPAGPRLAAVVTLTGWTTLAAGLLAVPPKGVLAPLLPPLGCLLAARALGASAHPLPGWYAPLAVALVAGQLAAATGRRASLGPAVAVAAVAILATALLGPAAPGVGRRTPVDARVWVAAPVQPRTGVSPLQQYLALRDGTLPLHLTGTVSRPVAQLRMVTLTRFDGIYWTVAADYRRAGTVLPEAPVLPEAAMPAAEQITEEVRVIAPGPLAWLPAPGRPSRVSIADLGVDETTGDVIFPADRPVPSSYRAASPLPRLRWDLIPAADPAPRSGPLGFTETPALRDFITRTVADQPSGTAQLLALYERLALRNEFRYDQAKDVAGGHSLYQIQRLLLDKRGTSEQYASAFAVMVRLLGYDARVVMGFRPEYDTAHPTSFTIKARDVDAWVEVRFTDLGWVTFDPSPRSNPIGSRTGAPPAASQQNPANDPVRDAADAQQSRPDPAAPPSRTTDPVPPPHPAARSVPALAALGSVVLFLVFAIPSAKAVRRFRRRHARSPRLAVLGAWRETTDRLRESGLPVSAARTTGEVVRLASGSATLVTLAELVDRAGYAPEEPEPSLPAEAWALGRAARRQIHHDMPPVRRLLAPFDPRPLLRP